MTPAHPPLPTAWNLLFQPLAGSQTSTWISESLVGFMLKATRQNSGRSLYGLPPLPPVCRSPGSENWPVGTTWAIVIVVSLNASAFRSAHEDANAGTAQRHKSIGRVHFTNEIFMRASRWGEYTLDR